MPWTLSVAENFDQLTNDCFAELVNRMDEPPSEDMAREILYDVRLWRDFIAQHTAFVRNKQNPTALKPARDFISAKPVHRVFRVKPFNVVYQLDYVSSNAIAVSIFHDRDREKNIGKTFR